MKLAKKFAVLFMAAAMAVGSVVVPQTDPFGIETVMGKVKIDQKTLDLKVGDTAELKIKGAKKVKKWTTDNEAVATVEKNGKKKATVTAVGEGTATITAKVGKKKYTCTVTVTAETPVPPVDGGWEAAESPVVTEDILAYANSVVTDAPYLPVALLATQVVAGMNYRLLCVKTPAAEGDMSTYIILTMYVDPDGKASFKDVYDTEQQAAKNDDAPGSWDYTESPVVTDEARAAFDKATENLTGASYKPLALLETQVVSGVNYLFVAEKTTVEPESLPVPCFVSVYEDLTGAAEIIDIVEIKPASAEPTDPTNPTDPIVGGWTPYDKIVGDNVPDEAKAVFADAMAAYDGLDLEPAALLAVNKTTDAGDKLLFLAKEKDIPETAKSGWFFVAVDHDDQGTTFKNAVEIDPANLLTVDEKPEGEIGGTLELVDAADQITGLEEEVREAFEKADEGYTGLALFPLAVTATQVVDGTNYLIVCMGTTVTVEPEEGLYFVNLYVSPAGDSEFSVKMIDVKEYTNPEDI